MDENWKETDKSIRQSIIVDRRLNNFLKPVFPNFNERGAFIKKCLKKLKTRRMLLNAQWYIEIADDQKKIRNNGSALKIIFLIALAESTTKMRISNNKIESLKGIQDFFQHSLPEDRKMIVQNFQRASVSAKLRFSSIIRILYEVRNKAVHGEDYYSFSLLDKDEKEKHKDYTDFGLLTFGALGKRARKRRVPLEISMTYEEIRDVFRRTAIANIKSSL